MLVGIKPSFAYVRIPKTISVSLSIILHDHEEIEHETRDSIPEGVWSFAFVRNPFDRFIALHQIGRKMSSIDVPTFQAQVATGLYTKADMFKPMCESIQGVNRLYRNEDLEDDLTNLFGRLGIRKPLVHHTPRDHRPFYTRELRALVEKLYARDLDLFGYSF